MEELAWESAEEFLLESPVEFVLEGLVIVALLLVVELVATAETKVEIAVCSIVVIAAVV